MRCARSTRRPAALRIGELIALRVEGRNALQVAMVRWFRNTLKCSGARIRLRAAVRQPRSGGGRAGGRARQRRCSRSSSSPRTRPTGTEASPPQIIVPAGAFALEQAIALRRGSDTGFAVLTKLVEQGPGFELFEFVAGRLTARRRDARAAARASRVAALVALVLLDAAVGDRARAAAAGRLAGSR